VKGLPSMDSRGGARLVGCSPRGGAVLSRTYQPKSFAHYFLSLSIFQFPRKHALFFVIPPKIMESCI
jgi:hypothetical protein